MFTIEHDFDATVITLIDEGEAPLKEDITIEAFEDCVVIEQLDPLTDVPMRLTLSMAQLRDLAAALNLPEGSYRIEFAPDPEPAKAKKPRKSAKAAPGPTKPPADIA